LTRSRWRASCCPCSPTGEHRQEREAVLALGCAGLHLGARGCWVLWGMHGVHVDALLAHQCSTPARLLFFPNPLTLSPPLSRPFAAPRPFRPPLQGRPAEGS
jgi:hypothetical protein